MRRNLIFYLLIFSSCKNQISVSGVVLDQTTKAPIENALIRTIKDFGGSKLEFVEAKSRNGKFHISYSTYTSIADTIALEVSKPGYMTNMYFFDRDNLNDTVYLIREFSN